MCKPRKNLTFNRDLYLVIKGLNDHDRPRYYDLIFQHFFDGIDLPKKYDTESLRVAISCTAPALRKMDSHYKNGICKKIYYQNKDLLCPSDQSNMKKNQATARDNIYNNQSILNIINNIYKYIYNQSTSIYNNPREAREAFKRPLDRLDNVLKKLSAETPYLLELLNQTINHIDRTQTLKVYGKAISKTEIMQSIETMLLREDALELMKSLRDELEQTKGVRNIAGYFATMLFNASRLPILQKNAKRGSTTCNFEQRDYSGVDLNSLYDDLSSIVLDENEYKNTTKGEQK